MTSKNTKGKRRLAIERAVYSVDELAILLGRNRLNIYSALRKKLIPSRRLGGKYLISRDAIHKWLDSGDDSTLDAA